MAVAWVLCPYERYLDSEGVALRIHDRPVRAPAIVMSHGPAIQAEGGALRFVETAGGMALCQVRASEALIASLPYTRLPKASLGESLADLSAAQRNALQADLQGMGYTLSEIRAALSNDLRSRTLGEVLRFACSRRRKPRYDAGADWYVLDGDPIPPTQPDALEG